MAARGLTVASNSLLHLQRPVRYNEFILKSCMMNALELLHFVPPPKTGIKSHLYHNMVPMKTTNPLAKIQELVGLRQWLNKNVMGLELQRHQKQIL